VGFELGSTLYRLLGEDRVVWEPLRWRISERAVYAARAAVAPAGAKGRLSGSSWNFGGDPDLTIRR
jgi:hypothetical protein